MVCVYCGSKTRVTNSRPQKKQNSVWRRRHCTECNAIFTSIEHVDLSTSLLVTNSMNSSEPFQRDKLLISLYDSLKHRKTALRDATALTDTIIGQVFKDNSTASISQAWLIDTVTTTLERFDSVAAIHYTAYYNQK